MLKKKMYHPVVCLYGTNGKMEHGLTTVLKHTHGDEMSSTVISTGAKWLNFGQTQICFTTDEDIRKAIRLLRRLLDK